MVSKLYYKFNVSSQNPEILFCEDLSSSPKIHNPRVKEQETSNFCNGRFDKSENTHWEQLEILVQMYFKNLPDIMLKERSQELEYIYHMIPFLWNLEKTTLNYGEKTG